MAAVTSTQRQVRRRVLQRLGEGVGRLVPITSLTVTTIVASVMAVGGLAAQAYEGWYLLRSDTASAADRRRRCAGASGAEAFTSSSGTFRHTGTNYADTTATSEYLELWRKDPDKADRAIQVALKRVKFRDRTEIPSYQGTRYPLDELTWLEGPGEVEKVCWYPLGVLSRNRHMQKWHTYSTAGALTLDGWTFAGSGGTLARSTTEARRNQYTAALTRAGTNVTLTQTIGPLWGGVSAQSLRGRDVTISLVVWGDTASAVRVQVLEDGSVVASSSYHTGGSQFEELTVSRTVAATVDALTVRVIVEVDSTCYVEDCYLALGDTISDALRRDDYSNEVEVAKRWLQDAGLTLELENHGIGGQYVVYSDRGYPEFDEPRVLAGSADADATDCPLDTLVPMTVSVWYEQEWMAEGSPDVSKNRQAMVYWRKQADERAAGHTVVDEPPGGGAFFPRNRSGMPTGRIW